MSRRDTTIRTRFVSIAPSRLWTFPSAIGRGPEDHGPRLGGSHDSRGAKALRFMETTRWLRIVKREPVPYNRFDATHKTLFFGVDSL